MTVYEQIVQSKHRPIVLHNKHWRLVIFNRLCFDVFFSGFFTLCFVSYIQQRRRNVPDIVINHNRTEIQWRYYLCRRLANVTADSMFSKHYRDDFNVGLLATECQNKFGIGSVWLAETRTHVHTWPTTYRNFVKHSFFYLNRQVA